MPVTLVGIVYYADDPHQRVFRRIYPQYDDSELDAPCEDVRDANGQPMAWADFGVDEARPRTSQKVAKAELPSKAKLVGTPFTPASEPVVYYVNADALLATLTENERALVNTWVGANSAWSNNFVDLGTGDVAALTAGIVSPAWIVVVGAGAPSVGTQQKQQTVKGQPIALWTL